MDRKPTNIELTQAERDRQEFIELLLFLQENDPDGFAALWAKAKALLTGEVKANG